ncbi:MAG TPA: hypothetical protein VFJ97_05355 [Dermatophilaceae bacterium]|nr:hypothetical protein [Dermatophilaceae bacterium]
MLVRAAPALTLGLALLLGGCVVPARSAGHYRDDATAAVQSAQSEAQTVALVLAQVDRRRVTDQAAEVVVSEAEDAIAPLEASFGSVQPPSPALDPVRAAVMTALGDADDAIAAARIALRRDDAAGRAAAAGQLRQVLGELAGLSERLS